MVARPRARRMRIFSLLLTAFAAAMSVGALGQTPAPAPAREVPWLPLISNDQKVLLTTAEVNGRNAVALIDTGSGNVILSRHLAEQLGRALTPIGEATSVGGQQKFWKAEGIRLAFGGLRAPEAAVQVSDFSAVETVLGRPIDLVIGASFLSQHSIEVDLHHARIRVGSVPADDPGAVAVPVRYDRTTRRMTVPGVLAGVRLPIMLDTGADTDFTISDEALEQLPASARKLTTFMVAGGGGTEVETIIDLPGLDLGPLSLGRTQVNATKAGGLLAKAGVPASVGMGVLARYNFVLDAPTGRLLLHRRVDPPPPAPKSTVGVQGTYKADRIAILHIMANSPAERAGLRAGDEICVVNGEKVVDGWAHSPMRSWGVRPSGQKYTILLCSGRTVELVSAAFY